MYDTETIGQALGRVRAPEELWARIAEARSPRRTASPVRKLGWAVAAAMILAGVAWNLPRPEFRSEDPGELRAWVKARTGLDLPFAAHTATVYVTGAKLTRSGVEVVYRNGGRFATFSVSEASAGETVHWSSNGRSYVLACALPGDLDGSCRLCHI